MHDRDSNTYFVLYGTNNPVMFDNKTEISDVAYTRKYLDALSDDSNVIVLSIPQVIRMSPSALHDHLREKGYEPKVSQQE